ncbi:uncharacterized protein LOC111876308 [Lactuca sativa]|uniref:uncharacterized protein LOC111876308 n=1 Tax=Lactuca sativa TaxID=4236 RepID=UPI000CD90AE4|nr:uncharacterized protein LOC111876308 [Lactuca sativa]
MEMVFESGNYSNKQNVFVVKQLKTGVLSWWEKTGHYGKECTSKKRVGYRCNEEWHIPRDWPKKKLAARPKARAFQMNLEAARDEADVASSIFLVNGLPANVLFDSGANHSYISRKFGGRLALPVNKLDSALVVEVVSGKLIHVSDSIKNIIIDLNENKFHEELPIELNGFDIVLGMDWLSANDAEILCRK